MAHPDPFGADHRHIYHPGAGGPHRRAASQPGRRPADLRSRGGRRQLRAGVGRRSRPDRRLRRPRDRGARGDRGAARVRRRPLLRLRVRPRARIHAVRRGQHDGLQPSADGTGLAGRGAGRHCRGPQTRRRQARQVNGFGAGTRQPGRSRVLADRRRGRFPHPRDRPHPSGAGAGAAGLVRLLPLQAQPRRCRGARSGRHRRRPRTPARPRPANSRHRSCSRCRAP